MSDSYVTIHNSRFKLTINEARIQEVVTEIAKQLNTELKGEKPLFLSVLNGSFLFTADLVKQFSGECEVSFIKMASYAGMQGGDIKSLIGLNEDITGRTVVIIEDIIDSGATVAALLGELQNKNPKCVKVATLIFKPDAFNRNYKVDYIGLKIPNDFIVGYGMDYDGLGRNLRDIYVIDPE